MGQEPKYYLVFVCNVVDNLICDGFVLRIRVLITGQYGWTALAYACGNGHVDVAKLLLASGANIELRNHVSEFIAYIKALTLIRREGTMQFLFSKIILVVFIKEILTLYLASAPGSVVS